MFWGFTQRRSLSLAAVSELNSGSQKPTESHRPSVTDTDLSSRDNSHNSLRGAETAFIRTDQRDGPGRGPTTYLRAERIVDIFRINKYSEYKE